MKLMKFYMVLLLCMLSLQVIQAQNESLCLPASIEVREGNTTVTCEPGALTWIRFKTSRVNTPYAFAVTDQDGNILKFSISDKVSFLGLPGGKLRVYAVSYIGLVLAEEGDNLFTADLASVCSAISPNYIEVENIVPEGGKVRSSNGRTTEYICTDDDLADILSFRTDVEEPFYAYIITDDANIVLSVSTDGIADFTNAPAGICRVYGLSYTGDILAQPGQELFGQNLAEGCYDVSDNYVSVVRTEPEGATITANGSSEDIVACDYPAGTGFTIALANSNDQTFSYGYLISDEAEADYTVVAGESIALSDLPPGTSRIRGISYAGELSAGSGSFDEVITAAVGCFDLSDNFVRVTRQYVEGGTIAFADGSTSFRACGLDDISDVFSFQTTSSSPENYAWILSDAGNRIIGVFTENEINIDSIEDIHDFRVHGLSYSGELLPVTGTRVNNAAFSDGCFQISENFVSITRLLPDGGTVSLTNGNEEFAGCDSPDILGDISLDLGNTGNADFAYIYLITDTDYNIIALNESGTITLSDLPEGSSLVLGLSYEGALLAQLGDNAQSTTLVDGCYDLSDNALSIERTLVDGGTISLSDGSTAVTVCGTDDLTDTFNFQTSSSAQADYAWVLTDINDNILAVEPADQLSIDEITNKDRFKVWGLSYSGSLLPVIGEKISVALSDGCFQLSVNFVSIRRLVPNGGQVTVSAGNTEFFGCDSPDLEGQIVIDLQNTGKSNFEYAYLVTDIDGKILLIVEDDNVALSDLPEGSSRIWGINYEGSLTAQPGDDIGVSTLVDGCFDLSDNAASIERTLVEGGTVSLSDGSTNITVCGTDDIADLFTIQTTSTAQSDYAWVLTDNNDNILAVQADNDISIDDITNRDRFKVWGLSYSGTLLPVIGEKITVDLSDGCFRLSDNSVSIRRLVPDARTISLTDGSTSFFGCDSPDLEGQIMLDLQNTGKTGFAYAYFVTDDNNQLLQIVTGSSVALSDFPAGTSRIWGINYEGTLAAQIGDNVLTKSGLADCYDLSDNSINVERTVVDGGDIAILDGSTEALTCGNDDIPDAFTFNSTTIAKDKNYILVVTDQNNRIFATANGGIIDFDLFAAGIYRVWGLSFTGVPNVPFGKNLNSIALSDGCYDLSNNFVTIRQEETNGGTLQFAGGGTQFFTCPGDGNADVLRFVHNGFSSQDYAYLITDPNNVILDMTANNTYDFESYPEGTCRVWGLAYSGTLNAPVGSSLNGLAFSDECYSLSSNFLTVVKETPTAGVISLADSAADTVFTCPNDGIPDMISFETTSQYPGVYLYLITHEDDRVVDVSFTGTYNFDFAEPGTCHVYGVAFTGNWVIQEGDIITETILSDDCYVITENYITIVREQPTAGDISFADGSDLKYTCPGDGKADSLSFVNTTSYLGSYIYLITDENGIILASTEDNSFDFEDVDLEVCQVYGAAYTGDLAFQPGDDINVVNISDDCFDLTPDPLTVVRDNPDGGTISTLGLTEISLCVGDAFADVLPFEVADASNSNYLFLITDEAGILISTFSGPEFDFNDTGKGIVRVYGLAYTGDLLIEAGDDIQAGPLTSDCFDLSENFVTLDRLLVDGSVISTGSGSTDIEYICSGDGNPDVVNFQTQNDDSRVSYQYLITNTKNIIIGDINDDMLDLENSPFDTIRVWGVAYTGGSIPATGMNVTTAQLSDNCYDVSDNFLTLVNDLPEGGSISTLSGQDTTIVCIGGADGLLSMVNNSPSQSGYLYLITDLNGIILDDSGSGATLDFNPFEPGSYLVYGLSYTGQLSYAIGDDIATTTLASSCYELSVNIVSVERMPELDGGSIISAFGNPLYVCLNDGVPDLGAFETTSQDANYRYVITDTLNNILIPDIGGNVIDFDKAQPNFCRVYGVSYTGNFTAAAGQNVLEEPLSDVCSAISENYIDLIKANFIGGTVATIAGDTEITVVVGDGNPDVVEFANSDASGVDYAFIITNEDNEILSILNGQATNFEPSEEGICRVWGLSYSGEITVGAGAVIDQEVLTTGCADLSENFIIVNKTTQGTPLVQQPQESTGLSRPNLRLHLYPNPVSHSINLQLRKLQNFEEGGEVLIRVFDVSGKPRLTEKRALDNHEITYPLDVSDLPVGMYVVLISDGTSSVQERFFKQ
jgi:hypothetical protein